MGLASLSHTTDAAGAEIQTRRGLDPGTLYSVTVIPLVTPVMKGTLLVTVTIQRGGQGSSFTGATLIHDYAYDNHFPSYDGAIQIEASDEIVLTSRASVAVAITCNALISPPGD